MQRRLWLAVIGTGGLLSAGGIAVLGRRATTTIATPEEDVCIVAPTFAYDPASGLPPDAAREVPPDARCPVCGMFPARARRWAAQVIFVDGDVQYLDSPLSLFHYLQRVNRYTPGRKLADIATLYVSDQLSGHWLQADQAVYVHGSDRMGPMRSGNLPAFADVASARAFIVLHGGRTVTAVSLRKGLPADLQKLAPHAHDTPH